MPKRIKLKIGICVLLDELTGFEEAWKGNAGKHLPGWTGSFTGIDNIGKLALAALKCSLLLLLQ
jgi:hypothetical protein